MHWNQWKMNLIALAVLLVLPTAACGAKPKAEGQEVTAVQQPEQSAEESKEPQQRQEPPQKEDATVKQGKGSFTGLADPHTVEIIVDGEPQAFQFGENLKKAVDAIEPDQQVEFKYEERPIEGDVSLKQLVLIEIKKAGSSH